MGNGDSIVEKKFYAFRIYKLIEDGPLFKSGLRELEDFIIPPALFNNNEYEIREYLNKCLEKEIDLKIYNLNTKNFSFVKVTPSLTWKKAEKGCLGAIICYENYLNAENNLLRIISVISNTLCDKIGLIPYEDYIIGVKPHKEHIISLNSPQGTDPIILFTNVLKTNIKRDIQLYVYNSKIGAKIIKLNLALKKGEIFGCDVIYGNGHEFPLKYESSPGEIRSEMDLNKSIAVSNLPYLNSVKENKKKSRSFVSSINLSNSCSSNEIVNTRTISPLSLSKLSNENELDSININQKEFEKN